MQLWQVVLKNKNNIHEKYCISTKLVSTLQEAKNKYNSEWQEVIGLANMIEVFEIAEVCKCCGK